MKKRIASFSPVARHSAQTLILGSIPGEASLRASQYYAHPRNAFWKIMAEVIGFDPGAPYEKRLEALKTADIALWDVLDTCHRKGSLDSAIEADSVEVNDFHAFFDKHPHIKTVCFNGAAAEHNYRKYVLPNCKLTSIHYIRLPSTSPAHAALSYAQKLTAWRNAIDTQ